MRVVAFWLMLVLAVAGCTPPSERTGSAPGSPSGVAAAPRVQRLTAAVQSDPPVLSTRMTSALEPGLDAITDLINPGLVTIDNQGSPRPVLVESVPSIENGGWKVFPDGRMETVWKLRAGVVWHDGAPFSAQDVLFTHRVDQDPDLPITPNIAYRSIERIDALDPSTIVVTWKQPYIEADIAFVADVLAAHLLEAAYTEDSAGFAQHPYWNREPVGVGPYRVREWVRGRSLVLDASPTFPLGRPKIDIIEVKFVPDQNTLIANILAGAVELTLGKTLTAEQAIQVREQWREGRVESAPANALQIFPQFLNPTPAALADVRFRRALLHAVDRQELADSLLFGLSSVVHSYLTPNDAPAYQAVANRVVRYDYDPRRAGQLLEEMGYGRAPDGMLRDAAGQRVALEIRTITTDVNQKAMLAAVDAWQRAGIAAEPFVIPRQRAQEAEYRATYPALELVRNPADRDGLKRHPGSLTPLPENNFRGNNRTRYMNPEFDGLLERYFSTIPLGARAQVFGDILQHMTDRVLVMGLFYDVDPTAISNRLVNVNARQVRSTQAWNAYLWDVQG